MGKKAHNDCRYFKNGKCTADEEMCGYTAYPDSCSGYEPIGLGKNRTIQRNKDRRAKQERLRDINND